MRTPRLHGARSPAAIAASRRRRNATVPADTTSTTDSPGAGTFRYRVQAFNAVGDSSWSGWTQINN